MYGRLVIENLPMDQSDIRYILDMLDDAIASKDWDAVIEARDEMKNEFLDVKRAEDDDNDDNT